MLKHFFRNRDDHQIDAQIKRVLDEMDKEEPGNEKYRALVTMLDRLHEMKVQRRMPRVSPDTVALIVGNLFGIAMYMLYENRHVITSKAVPLPIRTERGK